MVGLMLVLLLVLINAGVGVGSGVSAVGSANIDTNDRIMIGLTSDFIVFMT